MFDRSFGMYLKQLDDRCAFFGKLIDNMGDLQQRIIIFGSVSNPLKSIIFYIRNLFLILFFHYSTNNGNFAGKNL
jgi:hypothetical protein